MDHAATSSRHDGSATVPNDVPVQGTKAVLVGPSGLHGHSSVLLWGHVVLR